MPQNFHFNRGDAYVTTHLTPGEILAVQVWQNERLDYQFSFHTQHEAGWPCYLLEPDGPNRNLPKINLKVPGTAPVLEGASIRDNAVGADFAAVIRANIPLFQKLAAAYYDVETDQPAPGPLWVVNYTCSLARNAKPLIFGLPRRAQGNLASTFWANMRGRTKKPTCAMHRSPECLTESVELLSATDASKVKKHYKDSGEVIDMG